MPPEKKKKAARKKTSSKPLPSNPITGSGQSGLRVLGLNPRVVYTFMSATLILLGTLVAIQYAKGNFRVTQEGIVANTGLLAANSFPPGAQIYVNDRLVSATDDTLYLEPGQYQVRIEKEGYIPWQKNLTLEPELVTQTNATLFPQVPSLSPLTFTGVENIKPSPDGQKLLYYTASSSAETKHGLYVLELTDNPLAIQRGSKQISNNPRSINLTSAQVLWSPDSTQILTIGQNKEALLNLDQNQNLDAAVDVSFRRSSILSEWEEEMYIRERQFLREFPEEVIAMATQSAKNAYLSPDKKRLLYTATETVTLAEGLVPPPPSTNTQPESRTLEPGGIYVYDREEDKNFKVGQEPPLTIDEADLEVTEAEDQLPNQPGFEPNSVGVVTKTLLATDLYNRQPLELESSPSAFTRLQASDSARLAKNFSTYHSSLFANTYQWFPDSKHLIYTTNNQIHIMEYDGTNDTVVFSGPFADNFVYPWPDGSKLIITTRFSPDTPLNLYAIDLK